MNEAKHRIKPRLPVFGLRLWAQGLDWKRKQEKEAQAGSWRFQPGGRAWPRSGEPSSFGHRGARLGQLRCAHGHVPLGISEEPQSAQDKGLKKGKQQPQSGHQVPEDSRTHRWPDGNGDALVGKGKRRIALHTSVFFVRSSTHHPEALRGGGGSRCVRTVVTGGGPPAPVSSPRCAHRSLRQVPVSAVCKEPAEGRRRCPSYGSEPSLLQRKGVAPAPWPRCTLAPSPARVGPASWKVSRPLLSAGHQLCRAGQA